MKSVVPYGGALKRIGGTVPLDTQHEIAALMLLLDEAEQIDNPTHRIETKRKILGDIIEGKRFIGIITEAALRQYLISVMRVIRSHVRNEDILRNIAEDLAAIPIATNYNPRNSR